MPLPDLIEIVPVNKPVQAEITVPGSKSITNRALILAALGEGETALQGALWSEDTQVMVECLQELGFMVNTTADPEETCNRTITVYGKGGIVPPGGTEDRPVDLFVGNAGTAARFLAAFVCLGKGSYRLHGMPRMHERPQAALFQALRELGYRVDSPNNKLPAIVHGAGARPGKCRVSITESSQFASALLLAARFGGWNVEVVGKNAEESPYVTLTTKLIADFPAPGGRFQIEPDASSGSYFLGAHSILNTAEPTSQVRVRHWPETGWQIDEAFRKIVGRPARALPPSDENHPRVTLPDELSREHDLGDSIMTAAVLAPMADHIVRLVDLGRLRLQETERVSALRIELSKCGAEVREKGDTLMILPSAHNLHGAEIETYNDHRMAMCFAILGLKVPGIKLKNPACVKKTFPNFFQKLAAAPPQGLGATVRHGQTGQMLSVGELFAE